MPRALSQTHESVRELGVSRVFALGMLGVRHRGDRPAKVASAAALWGRWGAARGEGDWTTPDPPGGWTRTATGAKGHHHLDGTTHTTTSGDRPRLATGEWSGARTRQQPAIWSVTARTSYLTTGHTTSRRTTTGPTTNRRVPTTTRAVTNRREPGHRCSGAVPTTGRLTARRVVAARVTPTFTTTGSIPTRATSSRSTTGPTTNRRLPTSATATRPRAVGTTTNPLTTGCSVNRR